MVLHCWHIVIITIMARGGLLPGLSYGQCVLIHKDTGSCRIIDWSQVGPTLDRFQKVVHIDAQLLDDVSVVGQIVDVHVEHQIKPEGQQRRAQTVSTEYW